MAESSFGVVRGRLRFLAVWLILFLMSEIMHESNRRERVSQREDRNLSKVIDLAGTSTWLIESFDEIGNFVICARSDSEY